MVMQKNKKYDIVGIGNAIVDLIAEVDDSYLKKNTITKGSMSLVDYEVVNRIGNEVNIIRSISGGSVANSIVSIAQQNLKTAFIGKVNQDELGEKFSQGLKKEKVEFKITKSSTNKYTARCVILVSTDAERTMNTYLGISQELTEEDIDLGIISNSSILYLEGYLWDLDNAKKAILEAVTPRIREFIEAQLMESDEEESDKNEIDAEKKDDEETEEDVDVVLDESALKALINLVGGEEILHCRTFVSVSQTLLRPRLGILRLCNPRLFPAFVVAGLYFPADAGNLEYITTAFTGLGNQAEGLRAHALGWKEKIEHDSTLLQFILYRFTVFFKHIAAVLGTSRRLGAAPPATSNAVQPPPSRRPRPRRLTVAPSSLLPLAKIGARRPRQRASTRRRLRRASSTVVASTVDGGVGGGGKEGHEGLKLAPNRWLFRGLKRTSPTYL